MRFHGIAMTAGWLVLSATGCSSGGSTSTNPGTGGTSGGGSTVAEGDYVSAYIDALCSGYASCCTTQGHAADVAACRGQVETAIAGAQNPLGGGPNTTYDAQAAAVCLGLIRSALAACTQGTDPTRVCARVYQGALPAGAACTDDDQCAPSTGGDATCNAQGVCEIDVHGRLGYACGGTCTVGPGGGSCGGVGATPGAPPPRTCYTNEGLYCADDDTCQPVIALGQACTGTQTCVDGAYCNGQCVPRQAGGAACTSADQCLGDCDSATGQCVDFATTRPITTDASSCSGETLPDFDQ
jgi:hypothetical protein